MKLILRQSGLTLVEMVVFIVIVSVALAGVILVLNQSVRGSADPMIRKQALSIAESLLTEILQQPFSYCDPQDVNVETATSTAGCTGGLAASQDIGGGVTGSVVTGPMPNTETRGSATDPFDNVADYGGWSMNNVTDITGANAMPGYNASVRITRAGGAAPFVSIPADAALRVEVTVAAGRESVTLVGHRLRYAPNL